MVRPRHKTWRFKRSCKNDFVEFVGKGVEGDGVARMDVFHTVRSAEEDIKLT